MYHIYKDNTSRQVLSRLWLKKPLFLGLFFLISYNLPLNALSITAQPPSLDLSVNPAGIRTFAIEVANASAKDTQKVKVYVETVRISKTGDIDFVSLQDDPQGPAAWLTTKHNTATLRPLKKTNMAFRLRVPANVVSGGYYAAIIVEPDIQAKASERGLQVAFRLASIVRITVKGQQPLEKKINIDDFSSLRGIFNPETIGIEDKTSLSARIADEFPDKPGVFITALVSNAGNIHANVEISALIRDSQNRRVDEVKLKGGTGIVYPGAGRYFVAPLRRQITSGDYTAQLRLYYDGPKAIIQEFPFSIDVSQGAGAAEGSVFAAFEASPEELSFEMSRGSFRTAKFSFLSRLPEPATVRLSFESAGGSWIEFVEPRFTAMPGRTKDIIFRLKPAELMSAGDYSGIIIVDGKEPDQKKRIKVDLRIRE